MPAWLLTSRPIVPSTSEPWLPVLAQVPYFNAPIYLENKSDVGKVSAREDVWLYASYDPASHRWFAHRLPG